MLAKWANSPFTHAKLYSWLYYFLISLGTSEMLACTCAINFKICAWSAFSTLFQCSALFECCEPCYSNSRKKQHVLSGKIDPAGISNLCPLQQINLVRAHLSGLCKMLSCFFRITALCPSAIMARFWAAWGGYRRAYNEDFTASRKRLLLVLSEEFQNLKNSIPGCFNCSTGSHLGRHINLLPGGKAILSNCL